jgi:hypothetical protein
MIMDLCMIHLFNSLGHHRKFRKQDIIFIQVLLSANPTMFLDEIQDPLTEIRNIEFYSTITTLSCTL